MMTRYFIRTILVICTLAGFAVASQAALLTVDDSEALANIGGTSAGSQGNLVFDPSGVLGWANYGSASLVPSASGGATAITATQIGAFTLETMTDTRFSQSWDGSSNTIGLRGRSTTGMASGEGFRFSFVPGAVGDYSLMIHIADYNLDPNYAVTQGGNAVGSGAITVFTGNGATLDEGLVYFNFTVEDATEAAATWNFDITSETGIALVVGGVSLVPQVPESDPDLQIDVAFTLSNGYVAEAYQLPFTNGGSTENLIIASVTPGGADGAYFTVEAFTSPTSPGASGTIDFTFDPADGERTYIAEFTIASTDSDSPSTGVALSVKAQVPSVIDLGRIVCVGDSISEGKATRPDGEGNWSWRYWFWENLVDFNMGHEWVGTRTANRDGSSTYPGYQDESFVNRHESIWGTTALERANNAPSYLGALASTDQTPDTGIVFLGGNDIPLDLSVGAATVRDRIKTIVDNLQGDLGTSGNPEIRILLVSVLPRFTGSSLDVPDIRNARFEEINDLLEALASAETTATSEVLFLDLEPLFSAPPGLLYDGIHPNGAGEQLCGNAIFAALVPDMPALQAHIESIDAATGQINIMVRAHGPRNVWIEETVELSLTNSWSTSLPAQLNPGEWATMTVTESTPLPSKRFYRAAAE